MTVQGGETAAFIPVKWSATEPALDPSSPAWLSVAPVTVPVYPQIGVPPASAPTGVSAVKLRAQYSAKTIALHLEWPDDKPAKEGGVGRFADAAAVQWPRRYGAGELLPYVGMGHAGAPVALWFWRADGTVQTLAAEGFGTLTIQPPEGLEARGEWKDGIWRVVFARALAATGEHSLSLAPTQLGMLPLSVAVWNGEATERDGLKRLSSWQLLRFENGRDDAKYAKQLGGAVAGGDAGRGKRLMSEKGCAACHAFPDNPGQPRIGPDLTYAGGIHDAAYLLESLVEPSRVVVPGKGYSAEQAGKRASIMPPFAGTEAERRDIVSYLRSLK